MSKDNKKLRIGVFFGGSSSEKDVSLEGGRNVYRKLNLDKYDKLPIFIDHQYRFWLIPETLIIQNTCEDLERLVEREGERVKYENLKNKIDFAFVIGHGKYLEDGCLQGLLELLKISYNGPGVLGAALGMNKYIQRKILQGSGINVPNYVAVKKIDWQKNKKMIQGEIQKKLKLPFYVKPSREGCSTAITKVKSIEQLDQALEKAFKWDLSALVEEGIEGTEITVSILGNEEKQALPVTETPWRENNEYLTLLDKFLPGGAEMITPARITPEMTNLAQETAISVCEILNLIGYPRIDAFLTKNNKIVVLEPNTLPGITPSTMVFHQAAEINLTPQQFIDKIIDLGLEAHKNKKGPL